MTEKDRKKGENLLNDGCILVDCSGRTKNIGEKSAVGIASKRIEYSILMESKEKRKVLRKLLKCGYRDQQAKAMMHSVKLFYGIKNHIRAAPSIYICSDGFNVGLLKHNLKILLNFQYNDNKINIERSLKKCFTKKNIADRLASKVRSGEKKPSFILKEKHFKDLGLFK
jgi:hypothetical protein